MSSQEDIGDWEIVSNQTNDTDDFSAVEIETATEEDSTTSEAQSLDDLLHSISHPAAEPAQPSHSKQRTAPGEELVVCTVCNGYHYSHHCIYLLRRGDWLAYHAKHLSSQPVNYAKQKIDETEFLPRWSALPREQEAPTSTRPTTLGDAGLYADHMTHSSVAMFQEDEAWQRKLDKDHEGEERRFVGQNIEAQQLLVWAEDLESEDGHENRDVYSDCEQKFEDDQRDALSRLRRDLSRALPDLSTRRDERS